MPLQGTVAYANAVSPALERMLAGLDAQVLAVKLAEAGKQLERVVVLKYPPQTNAPLAKRYHWGGKPQKFKSLKAQRGFFAALARGDIDIPYRRTGKLARSLDFDIERGATASATIFIIVSINEQRARQGRPNFNPDWVVGEPQSRYFRVRTLWKPLPEMIAEQAASIEDALVVVLDLIAEDLRL